MTDRTSATAQPKAMGTGDRRIRITVIGMIVVGVLAWLAAYFAGQNEDLRLDLLSGLGGSGLTLAVGGVAGGLLTLLFKSHDARRQAREAEEDQRRAEHAARQAFYRAILDDLKSVYDRVERAKLLIEAHKSARTYGEQMRILPEANITLHNISRALRPGYDDLERDLHAPIMACRRFLKMLSAEFRESYKQISDEQAKDEAINRHNRDKIARGGDRDTMQTANAAWMKIADLPGLRVLRDDQRFDEYYVAFLWHIDLASFHLRKRLDGGTGRATGGALEDLRQDLAKAEARLAARSDASAAN
ncbi:MAG: hypothetical protein EP318_17285 [Rhodobacteraceae bacterium]|nr:MAG: hypothetical protein EP318_17285 [Paracoccaceae bacterium]